MQSLFQFHLNLGFEHILDLDGYDHIAYIVALCAVFSLAQWRKVLVLVTAFTLGHSVTLALVGLDVIRLSSEQKSLVEFLIPVTIIATALLNMYYQNRGEDSKVSFRFTYLLTAFFGLIHGLGFSSFFRSSMMPGEEAGVLFKKLLGFNLGVELGQLLVVAIVMLLSYLALNVFKVKKIVWVNVVSALAILISMYLLLK